MNYDDYINVEDTDGNWATFYECELCGAAVRDTYKHTAWHEQLPKKSTLAASW